MTTSRDKMGDKRRFGRLYIRDNRDANYPMRAALPASEPDRTYRYWWQSGWWGDQGRTPQCVAYACLHMLEDGPTTHFYESREEANPEYVDDDSPALVRPARLYDRAQELDRWSGDDYEGTSVRAGMKALQREGVIAEYRWAETLDDVVRALLTTGPVVVGTWWYDSMYQPAYSGKYDKEMVSPEGGQKVGGHAYVLNGVNTETGLFRLKNSWGRGWGNDGTAFVTFEDMETLLDEMGEACIPLEERLEED